MRKTKNEFNEYEIKKFDPCEKMALVATITPEGLPHISLLTTLQGIDGNHMAFGQFSTGASKDNLRSNPKAGWLIITLDKKMWSGKAFWTNSKTEGPEYELFNQKPMFRYNTYFGINTIHYLNLIETTLGENLPMFGIVKSLLKTKLAMRGIKRSKSNAEVLNSWAFNLINKTGTLTFLSYINKSGYPVIIPCLQCKATNSDTLVFSPSLYSDEYRDLANGQSTAVFSMNMKMESFLTRGTFQGFKKSRGIKYGSINVNYLYNTMIPKQGQIYPEVELRTLMPAEF